MTSLEGEEQLRKSKSSANFSERAGYFGG